MISPLLFNFAFLVYAAATVGLMVYAFNCYVLLLLFSRRREAARMARAGLSRNGRRPAEDADLPAVTTQIAVYNEYNVVDRAMRAACAIDYPAGKHEIQVLDDSTDETTALAERLARELRADGHDVKVLHRDHRRGFKAGALAEGLRQARGELVAVFDADFVPPRHYLRAIVPFFLEDPKLGFAQARWGHLNRDASMLTRVQSIGIDGHFIVEQIARGWNGLYMNFNGTAGLWRRSAIESAGGWQWDTLTEDLDLSYRVQFAGWKPLYVPDVVVPAELPEDIGALRGQQFRWAKGSFQTVLKLTPHLLRMPVSWFKKLQALLHMGGYFVHPLMLTLSLLAMPMLYLTRRFAPAPWFYTLIALPLVLSVIAPSTLYFVSQRVTYREWLRRVLFLPLLIVVGVGFAVSNSWAVVEALARRQSEFVRTPKRGDRAVKRYRVRLPPVAALEVALGLYSLATFGLYLNACKFVVGPFLAVYAAGFLFVGLLTVAHAYGWGESG